MATFGKIVASSRRSAPLLAQSITSKPQVGGISLFSTVPAPAAAFKKPLVLPSPPTQDNQRWRVALEDLQKKQNVEINNLQWLLDSMRIARIPNDTSTPTTFVPPAPQQPQQQHTFQVMNRNARKPKRANHGKRPCSRVRRRYKKRKWMNPSRRG